MRTLRNVSVRPMTNITRAIARFSSILVILGLMLGLAVAGCSDNDHQEGPVGPTTNLAAISYRFTQILTVEAKADRNVDSVLLTAYDRAGRAVVAEQGTAKVAEHKDVTPAGYVGTTIWEGVAQVDTRATNLVLFYLDANGQTVGDPDIIANVTIKEGASLDFTSEVEPVVEVTWRPAETKQNVEVGQSMAISATDADGNPLTVELNKQDSEAVDIIDNEVTGVSPTAEGETADVIAIALNDAGDAIAATTYNFTVSAPAPAVTWMPAEASQKAFISKRIPITAKDENDDDLVVELSTASNKVKIVDTNKVEGKTLTLPGEAVTVMATAKDGDGDVRGTMTYFFTVELPTLNWTPTPGPLTMRVGDDCPVTVQDDDGNYLSVTCFAYVAQYVNVVDNKMIAVKATPADEPVKVSFRTKLSSGERIEVNYFVTVIE